MAIPHPDLNPDEIVCHGERHLYLCFRDYLDHDWHLIHSLAYTDRSGLRTQLGEADFILLHARYGLLVIEAKSGCPMIDHTSGDWRFDDGTPMKNPLFQVRMACKSIVDHLRRSLPEWADDPPRYGHALAFPDTRSVRGTLPPDWNPAAVMMSGDLERLGDWARNAIMSFAPDAPDMGHELLSKTVATLVPTFTFQPSDTSRMATDEQVLVRLTDEQSFILDCLDENLRAVVRGSAGSGKTLIAAAQAARLSREGQRVLVLCYNNSLPDWIRQLCLDRGADVEVTTFHDKCMQVVEEVTGSRPPIPANQAAQQVFWNEELAELAYDASANLELRYDAVFVDEAQDFHELWWFFVEGLLADPGRSRLYLFMDAAQSIYERTMTLPPIQCRLNLKRNCRNTRAIAAFVSGLSGTEFSHLDRLPAGNPPEFIEVVDDDAELVAVRRVVHELVHGHGINPARMVILGFHALCNTRLGLRGRVGNLRVVEADEDGKPNCIRYSTVAKFKGLERDIVLLVEVGIESEYLSEARKQALLYVGASRAKHRLWIFTRPGYRLLERRHDSLGIANLDQDREEAGRMRGHDLHSGRQPSVPLKQERCSIHQQASSSQATSSSSGRSPTGNLLRSSGVDSLHVNDHPRGKLVVYSVGSGDSTSAAFRVTISATSLQRLAEHCSPGEFEWSLGDGSLSIVGRNGAWQLRFASSPGDGDVSKRLLNPQETRDFATALLGSRVSL